MAAKKKEKKAKGDDLISERARTLNDQIASLEAEIKRLDSQLQSSTAKPKLRSTTLPHGPTVSRKPAAGNDAASVLRKPEPPPKSVEPVFEEIKTKAVPSDAAEPGLYNELGVRKYDLPALWARIRNHFRGPATSNPRLVNYLAAGGVRGLRPLRYEKRVARNRFIALVIVLFFILLGVILIFVRHH